MPSSIKVFKSGNTVGSDVRTKITTEVNRKQRKSLKNTKENKETIAMHQAEVKKEKLLTEAEMQREKIIVQAEQEAEKMRQAAHEMGLKEGQEAGYQAGFQQGVQTGMEQAQLENKELRESILQMIQTTQAELKQYQEDKKEEFIRLASHMAQKIVHQHIDHADDGILLLAKPYLYQLNRDEEFVSITVHPEKYAYLQEHVDQIEKISPETRFIILEDPSIERRGILIESTRFIIDLQIQKQIDMMLQEFDEMERTVDA